MNALYYHDPYQTTFQARVVSCAPSGKGTYLIALDQTAFYPEGGGQPYDTGVLAVNAPQNEKSLSQANGPGPVTESIHVLEVHEKNGEILHTTDQSIKEGLAVTGAIDWDRRYQHMQQHSGEHLLTGLIHAKYGYDNVGFHMGTEEVTIDFNGLLTLEQLREIEILANQMIYANLPIHAAYPPSQELQQLEYRSKKELNGQVRIITIPNCDCCACCGTHVARTGEIGMVKVLGMIHYKGGVRISMLCGKKAWEDYDYRLGQTAAISRLLSVKPREAAKAVEKLRQECAAKDQKINQLSQQLFELKAARFPESSDPLLVWEQDLTPVQLRQLCTLLFEQGKGSVVLVCSGQEGRYQYALGSQRYDMRAVSKEVNSMLNGRGGGSALLAQGTFQSSRNEISDVFPARLSL